MTGNDSTITVRLPADIVERLDAIAAEQDVTRSRLVRRMLLDRIAETPRP